MADISYLGMKQRIELGFQCPECYSVNIEGRSDRYQAFKGYQCNDCGCNWSKKLSFGERKSNG